MSAYLDVAYRIGFELASAPAAHSGHWQGDGLVPDGRGGHEVKWLDVGADLYGGNAGIGLALACLSHAADDKLIASCACASLTTSLDDGDKMLSQGRLTLFGGAAGISYAARVGGKALGEVGLENKAADLMRGVAAAVARQSMPETDLIAGRAGVILALLSNGQHAPEGIMRRTVTQLCDELIADGAASWWGRSITTMSGHALCGLGHGASGVGWALISAGARLSEPRYTAAGEDFLKYEEGLFEPERCNWPDLRTREGNPSAAPGWMDAWCHGALGIGALRWHLWAADHAPLKLAQATAALFAARRYVTAQTASGALPDMTLCHGLCGAAELMLVAYQATGRSEHLSAARKVGDIILRLHEQADGRWTVGLPGGSDVPGLFLGRAGICATFLRLHDPDLMPSPALAGAPD
jgi:lantibiotic modifying enzyme